MTYRDRLIDWWRRQHEAKRGQSIADWWRALENRRR